MQLCQTINPGEGDPWDVGAGIFLDLISLQSPHTSMKINEPKWVITGHGSRVILNLTTGVSN